MADAGVWRDVVMILTVTEAGVWRDVVMILTVTDVGSVERRCNDTDSGRVLECGAAV